MIVDINWLDWHGLKSVTMENDFLKVVLIPSHGAKLVSLFDKRSKHEWLVQPDGDLPKRIPSRANFHNYSMFGWDEMFPTVLSCPYPIPGKFYKKELPDHGEVWFLAWEIEKTDNNALILSVSGHILPYRLTRKLSFYSQETIIMQYQVVNLSAENLAYLWAPHPFFICEPGDEIVLPSRVNEVCNVIERESWGKPGMYYNWPEALSLQGEKKHLNKIGSPENHTHSKFYISPKVAIEWAAIMKEESGEFLCMEWSSHRVPYCGFVIDEGFSSAFSRLSLEPCSGFYDSIEIAYKNKRISILSAKQTHEWDLFLHFGVDGKAIPNFIEEKKRARSY